MKHVLSATEARNRFFEILNSVMHRGEEFVIEKRDVGNVRVVPDRPKRSPEEIDKILKDFRKNFCQSS